MADSPIARARALAGILPAGVDVYVALFDGDPGGSGTELPLARVAHQNWTTVLGPGASSIRKNLGVIQFGALGVGATANNWAVFDASVGGDPVTCDQLTDGAGDPDEYAFIIGDEPSLADGTLQILIANV